MERQQYEQGVRHSFDSYCKKILKYTLINWHQEKKRRREREITFSDMPIIELANLSVLDEYFAEESVFSVLGETVIVLNPELAKALDTLPADSLEIVLMSYFLDTKDREIAERLNMVRGTVCYQRNSSLKKLKKFIESAG